MNTLSLALQYTLCSLNTLWFTNVHFLALSYILHTHSTLSQVYEYTRHFLWYEHTFLLSLISLIYVHTPHWFTNMYTLHSFSGLQTVYEYTYTLSWVTYKGNESTAQESPLAYSSPYKHIDTPLGEGDVRHLIYAATENIAGKEMIND